MSGRAILRVAVLCWMTFVYVSYWLTYVPRR
jgi:hypothetical protein